MCGPGLAVGVYVTVPEQCELSESEGTGVSVQVVEPGRFTVRVADQTATLDLAGDAPLVLSAP